MENRSRISRRLERQSKKNLFFALFGTLFLIILLIRYGPPLLVNLVLFMGNSKTAQDSGKRNVEIALPPILDPQPNATNSSTITISGKALPKQKISLYLNERMIDETKVNANNSFTFADVSLEKGENIIKVKSQTEESEESAFSEAATILLKKDLPTLVIDSPSEGQSFKKDVKTAVVSGKTNSGIKVTVNGFWAIVDEDGVFSYNLPLKEGENMIKVAAVDEAGNKIESERNVTYSP